MHFTGPRRTGSDNEAPILASVGYVRWVEVLKGGVRDYMVCLSKLLEPLEKALGIQFSGGLAQKREPWALPVTWGAEYALLGRSPRGRLLPPFSQ